MNITNLIKSQSRNCVIGMIMKETGWSKARAKKAINELEKNQLVLFPATGGAAISIIQEVI